MTTKPGEIYRVDLGMGGKVRMMLVVSREDRDAPRALSLCVPITTSNRGSGYEVELPSRPFFRSQSFANVQGLQAIQHHELQARVGVIFGDALDRVKDALRFALEL
ncbi:MAG: type II toxin-antitoxin system PemK/MazF family toxin [Luteolibacter sp.]